MDIYKAIEQLIFDIPIYTQSTLDQWITSLPRYQRSYPSMQRGPQIRCQGQSWFVMMLEDSTLKKGRMKDTNVDFTLFDKPIVRDSTRVQACTLPACSGKLILYPVVICQRRQWSHHTSSNRYPHRYRTEISHGVPKGFLNHQSWWWPKKVLLPWCLLTILHGFFP